MENVKHNLLVFLFGEQPDWTAMWTAVIALIAFVGVIVAPRQLVRIRATSRADFTFRFIESFFMRDKNAVLPPHQLGSGF